MVVMSKLKSGMLVS